MDTPQIYVACLVSYNNGILHGKWIDEYDSINDFSELLADGQTYV